MLLLPDADNGWFVDPILGTYQPLDDEFMADLPAGRVLRYTLLGRPGRWMEFRYDADGRLVEETSDNEGLIRWTYDGDGYLMRYDSDINRHQSVRASEFEWDAATGLASQVTYSVDAVQLSRVRYTADRDGRYASSVTTLLPSEDDVRWDRFEYDSVDRLTKWGINEHSFLWLYRIAWDGDRIVRSESIGQGSRDCIEYEYDDNGHILRLQQGPVCGSSEYRLLYLFEYDDRGNQTRWELWTPLGGLSESWTMEFDAQDRPLFRRHEQGTWWETLTTTYEEDVSCDPPPH
ncbi:MAG: hypothetical protein H6738_00365 [Alphaproteobacteria bacterium]|nr:hypothetical protein [Alphaproteobacteria bacterium]MCB9695220.1 hypothetical protein [Alphaproteobacteria bacterium]